MIAVDEVNICQIIVIDEAEIYNFAINADMYQMTVIGGEDI